MISPSLPERRLAALIETWRTEAQTHLNYAHHRDEPYDDVGHEHRVKAHVIDLKADELDALLSADAPAAALPETLSDEARADILAIQALSSLSDEGSSDEPGLGSAGMSPPTFPNARDCHHGRLRRACQECDLEQDRQELGAAIWPDQPHAPIDVLVTLATAHRTDSEAMSAVLGGHDPACCYCLVCRRLTGGGVPEQDHV